MITLLVLLLVSLLGLGAGLGAAGVLLIFLFPILDIFIAIKIIKKIFCH